jgi:hypothetical protein
MLMMGASMTATAPTQSPMAIDVAAELELLDAGSFDFARGGCYVCFADADECKGPLPTQHPPCGFEPGCYCMYCDGRWGCFKPDFATP